MNYMEQNKERLKELLWAILSKTGTISAEKLAHLVLFSEIEHFKKHGKSYTGLYFVKLESGPLIAFFEEALEEAKKEDFSLPPELNCVVEEVLSKYGNKDLSCLSELSRSLPAWKHAELYEPLYVAELAIKDEKAYRFFVAKVEDKEREDEPLMVLSFFPEP